LNNLYGRASITLLYPGVLVYEDKKFIDSVVSFRPELQSNDCTCRRG